jgi:integrase/recombinase XerD
MLALSDDGEEVAVDDGAADLGPLEPCIPGLVAWLTSLGYQRNALRTHRAVAGDLSRWLAGQGLDGAALTSAAVERFVAGRRAAGMPLVTVRALAPVLEYLRHLGVAPPPVTPAPATPAETLLEGYRRYLIDECGVGAATARRYAYRICPFVAGSATGRVDLERLTAGDVTAFILDLAGHRSPMAVQATASALRSLLRFLHVEGLIAAPLAQAVPTAACWSLAGLPRFLDNDQVQALLAGCDVRTVAGRRDVAIVTLLVRLGLRASEVAALRLEDIDWRDGEITITGKGNRRERLPLPADVGHAVVAYLQHGRPATTQGRPVFVRLRAPHQALTMKGVTRVVVRAGERAGLGAIGAHRLRHTAATRMLRAGAPLSEIGQVLRHDRPLTTALYAKVDIEGLRALARPWPGGTA